ncbi:hypothetical protein ACFX5Q_32360 [Mesorhizobium sp. IMUNJ 23033]|uniref:hypothetical protein n=1 Tax=Mesorhizobium sp. IMUNJ 23033 TaxID=3378039 RepID=UPI00384A91EC
MTTEQARQAFVSFSRIAMPSTATALLRRNRHKWLILPKRICQFSLTSCTVA